MQETRPRAPFSPVQSIRIEMPFWIMADERTGDDKSIGQKVMDSTSSKPGEESYLDTAKKTVEDAVEYVEKTATGTYFSVLFASIC